MHVTKPLYRAFKKEVDLFGYKYLLPDPPNKDKIVGSDKSDSQQIFIPDPRVYISERLGQTARGKLINREWARRKNGVYYMINGVMTYITGWHYYYLVYHPIKNKRTNGTRADFWHRDLLWFYGWDRSYNDPKSIGMIGPKARRMGDTEKGVCIYGDILTRTKNAHCGIQSKTEGDARTLFQEKAVKAIRAQPYFFRALEEGDKEPRTILRMSKPTGSAIGEFQKRKDLLPKNMKDEYYQIITEPLNGKGTFESSKPQAYAGSTLDYFLNDESGATPKSMQLDKRRKKVQPCSLQGARLVGKQLYIGAIEGLKKLSGGEFKTMFVDSMVDKIHKKTGWTPTKLSAFFAGAHLATEGYIDEYGNPYEQEAIEYIKAEIESLTGNLKDQTETIRHMAMAWRDCFRVADRSVSGAAEQMQARMDQLEDMFGPETMCNGQMLKNNLFVQGYKLVWENGNEPIPMQGNIARSKYGGLPKVKMIKNAEGPFFFSYIPNPDEINNVEVNASGLWFPQNPLRFIVGADPFTFDVVAGDKPSDGGIAVFRKYNMASEQRLDQGDMEDMDEMQRQEYYLKHKTKRFVMTYRERPNSIDKFCMEMLKVCFLFGAKIFEEKNNDRVLPFFKRMGCSRFLTYRIVKGKYANTSGMTNKGGNRQNLFEAMTKHVLESYENEVHWELYREFMEASYEELGPYDRLVAAMYACYGGTELGIESRITERSSNQKGGMSAWVDVY